MHVRPPLLLSLLLAGALLAGCASDENEGADDPGTATPGTPAATTPVPSTTPATATPTAGTPATPTPSTPVTTTPAANASLVRNVTVLAAPDRVAPNATAQVCFLVEGQGEIPHVAVHFDTVSHPNATAFSEYAGGAAYPGGGASSPRVSLPGVFCANLTAPASGTLHYRAHALAPPAQPGVLSVEKSLRVGEPVGVSFVGDLPEVAPANTNVTVCWRVAGGAGEVPHTALHFDTRSHPAAASFNEYAGGAAYPDNRTTMAGNATLPGPFCTNLRTPSSGALYYRAHVLGGAYPAPGNLSEERSLVVAPRVNVVGPVPATAPGGSNVRVCWRVEGEGVSPHVALHWDNASHPSATSFTEYAGGAVYAGGGTAAAASQALPGPFCAEVMMPWSGALYFRAHGVLPGVGLPGELGREHVVRVA